MSATSMTVGNLRLDTLIDMGGMDLGFQQLQSRIRQLESTTKLKIGIDTSAIDGGVTKATQGIQNLQRVAGTSTVLKVDSAQVTAATAAVTNHATAQKSAQTEITKTTQAVQQHSAAHASLQSAIGGTSQALQVATMQMGGFGQAVNVASMASSGFIGPLGLVVGGLAALTLGLGASAKAAVDFQTTVVQVANNTQMTNAELATMQEGVKQLALVIPASTTAMAEGWRHAADEGFNAADSLKIVNAASMAAVNTGAQVTDTIFLVSQVLHAYHEPATDAMLVTNQLVEAAKQGNTTFAQMAQAIGPLIAQAASLHIPLADIVGAMSAMTQNGYPADQAVTGLTNLLKEVEAPSQKAKDAIAALGDRGKLLVDDFTPAGLAGKGLYGVMKDLGTATDGDNAKILAILPQLRGFRSGVVLAGNGLDDYTKAMNTQADVMSGKLKPTQEDFARTMQTVGAKMQILKNTVEVLAIDLGTIFLPILTKVVQGIIDFAQSIGLLSGASGFKDVKKQIQDVNDSYAQTKTAQDAIAAANVTSGNTAAAAGVKSADAAQAHTDALANVRTAAGALDQALGFPNGQKGIGETVANLGNLEKSAKDQASTAIKNLNDTLILPNGISGPDAAKGALNQLKDAGAAATGVIQGLNAELAANKALLDQNAAAIQNVKNTYDPIIKSAEQHIRDINLLSPEELARKQRELELDKEKANLELTKPNTSVFDTAIATDKTSLDAMPRLDTGVWDDAIKADDKKLKSFDVSSYTAATQKQIDTLQDTDVAAPFKKQAQDIQDAMASLDPEEATRSITTTIQAIRDKSAALDPEQATRPFTNAIQGIRDHMASLDPTAATQGITDTIQGIRDSMSALDPEAATRGITDTIQGIQDAIHGLNTDALDQKINSIKDILAQPAPNTTGLNTAMAAIAAQIQGAGAGTDTSALQAQYGALSGQKTGIVRKYQEDTTGLKGQVKLLEQQRADQRLAQSETKRADEARIVDLTRQSTAIKEGITDTKAADAARITELTRQATQIKEGIADEKKADEARIVDLTRQSTQVKEAIADQKAADTARIVQLTRQAQTIKEGIADERKADEAKLRGIARDQAAAEKTKATSLATLADTLKGEQATATADKKKIDLDRAWNQEQKQNAVDLDRDARQKLTDDITHQERLKTAMLAPYTQQLAGIAAQQQQNSLLDTAAAAQRKMDIAPYLAQLDQAKQKETDELAPLLAKKQELDGIKSKLDEEKATWGGIKSAIDSAKSSLDNYFKSPVGGSGTSKGGAGIPPVAINPGSGAIPNPDIGSNAGDTTGGVPDSPILTQLKSLKQWLDEHGDTIKNAIKAMWHFDTGVFQFEVNAVSKIFQLGQDLWRGDWKKFVADLATINDEITTWLNDHGAQWATSFTALWKAIAGAYLGPDLRTQFDAVGGFFDDLGSKASEVGDKIKGGLGSAIQWLGDQFSNLGTTVEDTKNFLGEKFQDVQDAATRLKDWLGGIVGPGGSIGGFFDALGTKVSDVFQAIGNFFDALGFHANAFKENMATPMNLIGQMFSDLGTKADEWLGPNGKVGQFFDHTGTVAHALYDNSIGLVFGKGGLIGQAFDAVGGVANDWFAPGGKVGSFFDNVGTAAHRLYDATLGVLFGSGGLIGTAFSDLGGVANNWFGPGGKVGSFFDNVGTKTNELYNNTIGKIFGTGGQVSSSFNETGNVANGWFAPGGKIGQFFDNVGTKAGELRDGVTGAFSTLETWLGGWATRIGATVLAPFTAIGQGIHTFLAKIGDAVNWVGALFAFPAIDFSGIPGFAGGLDGKASGWGGGMAIVGEKGPEIMYVPTGANIATHEESRSLGLLPGFAGGLGDIFGGIVNAAKSVGGKAKDLLGKGEQWIVDQAVSKFGAFPAHIGELLGGIGKYELKESLDGIKNMIHDAFGNLPHPAAPTSGGTSGGAGIAGGGDLVAAIIAATGDKGEQMAMLMGAMLETGGQNVAQIGGGPGAGYWQIEAGPGGQYNPNTPGHNPTKTIADPYDAAAAARFMIPDYDAAMGYFDPNNLENSLVQVVVHAERPAGLKYGDGQIANAWGLLQPFLVNGGIAAPAQAAAGPVAPGGGWSDVIATANTLLGTGGFDECERWVGDVLGKAGYNHPRYATAQQDAWAQTNNSGTPPIGATVLWDFPPAGHVAFGGGDGSFLGTVNREGGKVDWQSAGTYGAPTGWRPPGLATGGYFDHESGPYMIGEGRDSEVVSPVPMLKEIVRENSGGGDIHVNFESGAILTHPGQSNTEVARMVVEEMNDRMLIERRRSGFPG